MAEEALGAATANTCWAAEVKIIKKYIVYTKTTTFDCFVLLPSAWKFINFISLKVIWHFIKQNFALCLQSKGILDDFTFKLFNTYFYFFVILWLQCRNKLQNVIYVRGFASLQMHFAHTYTHTKHEQFLLFRFCYGIPLENREQRECENKKNEAKTISNIYTLLYLQLR